MPRVIVVGSGAGGATVAKELAGRCDVTVLEAGARFRPFTSALSSLEWLRSTGFLVTERQVHVFFPAMRVEKTAGAVIVHGTGLGGTTTLSTGNAVRSDAGLREAGIDLDEEFEELGREIPVTVDHSALWKPSTHRMFGICRDMGLNPQPMPKMIDPSSCCQECGRCMLGCQRGAKWDSRKYLDAARDKGAHVITGCSVERLELANGRATGVHTRCGLVRRFFPADIVVLAAGGLGTPKILERSGFATEPSLFVDPLLCVAAELPGADQVLELPVPFMIRRGRCVIAPYFDLLSFFFRREWRRPSSATYCLMVMLADEGDGAVSVAGVRKALTDVDRGELASGAELCRELLGRLGAKEPFEGIVNAGHPGGTLALKGPELHPNRLPENVWVADASLLPRATGDAPMMTIMALAKRIAKQVNEAAGLKAAATA